MGVALEILPDAGAPQVGVTVSGLPAGSPSVVTVEWSVDGVEWEPVRGAVSVTVVGSGFFRHFTPPLNVETAYRLVTLESVTGGTTATITVPSEWAWMQDPMSPRGAVPVSCVRGDDGGVALMSPSAGDIVRRMPADIVQVQGARLPVASLGVRQAPAGVMLHLRAIMASQGALVRALAELIDTAGTVVLRGLPADLPLDPVAHVIAPEVTDSPIVGGLLGPRRDWVMSVTQVRPPAPRISVAWWTYSDVQAMWSTFSYDDALAARPGATYLDWLRNPSPEA